MTRMGHFLTLTKHYAAGFVVAATGAGSATKISTRLFFALSAAVLLDAIGSREPRPSTEKRLDATPRAAR